MRDESQHLGGWVAGVGAAFREASTLGIPLEEIDNFISKRVGEPTIYEAQQAAAGQQAAEELQAELLALGIDPDDFDPAQLWELYNSGETDDHERLFALMAGIGDQMVSEDFAVGFYDSLDTDGMRTVVGVIDTFAATGWMGSVRQDLLEPFVRGWAHASGSVDLTEERRELFDTEDPVEQRQLALLMSGPPHAYDPEWLADAAERILVTGADLNQVQYPSEWPQGLRQGDYPGFADWGWLYEDPTLGIPQLIATRALDGNVEAAWSFASRGGDHVEVLVRPGEIPVPFNVYTAGDLEGLQAAFETHAGGAIEAAFYEAPLSTRPDPDDPTRRIPMVDPAESAQAYNDLIAAVGEGDVPDVIKRSVARTLLPHLPEIGTAAADQFYTGQIETDVLFERPDLVAFFKELGYDEEAAAIVGEQVGLWGAARVDQLSQLTTNPTQEDFKRALDPVGLVVGATWQGFNETENAMAEANTALAFGLQQGSGLISGLGLSGPIIGFIAGGPPGAAVGAALAGGTQLVNQAGAFGAYTLRTRDTDLQFDGDDLKSQLVAGLREEYVGELVDQGVIPDDIPPREYGPVLAGMLGSDPFNNLDNDTFNRAFTRDADDQW